VNTVSDKHAKHLPTYVYIRDKMVSGGRHLLRENVAETDQPPSKTPISSQYALVRLSRNT